MTTPGQSGEAEPDGAWIADPRGGILLVIVSGILFAGLDTGAKYLTALYPVLQIAWGRYLFQLVLLPFILGRVRPRNMVRTRRPVLQVVRALLLMGATLTFFIAISYIPIADAAAIGAVSPLMVTALAIPLLGEKVGMRRWTAVVIGLLGALIIIRPGFGPAHWATVMPLVTALCYALSSRGSWRPDRHADPGGQRSAGDHLSLHRYRRHRPVLRRRAPSLGSHERVRLAGDDRRRLLGRGRPLLHYSLPIRLTPTPTTCRAAMILAQK